MPASAPDVLLRLLLLIAVLALPACDRHKPDWAETAETAFARHCFNLLQRREFGEIKAAASADLLATDLSGHLDQMAAMIPDEPPIGSRVTDVSVTTADGSTTGTASIAYHYRKAGWLQFDVATEGGGDAPTLTWISLHPGSPPDVRMIMLTALAFPVGLIVVLLAGITLYRRHAERKEALQATPTEAERRERWETMLRGRDTRTAWPLRLIGMRAVELESPLPPGECRRRLEASVARELALLRWFTGPRSAVKGRVGSGFRIGRNRSFVFSSHYQTYLHGRLLPGDAGTRIRCTLGPRWTTLLHSILPVVIMWTLLIPHLTEDGMLVVLPLVLTALFTAPLFFTPHRIRRDGPYLLDFLGQTLDATAAPARSVTIERTVRR